MNHPAAAFIAVGLMVATNASAQPARAPTPARSVKSTAVPVPRTAFILTMDSEFGKMDVNKNNLVTKAEIEQFQRAASAMEAQLRLRALFAQLDADRNGQLSPVEFSRMAVNSTAANAAPVLGLADLNRDGTITLVEYRTAKLAKFDAMDTDKDGIVSVAEMRSAGLVR